MDLWTLVRILWRRWLVVVPTLVLTAGAAAFFLMTVEPSYQGYSQLVLVSDDPQAAQQGYASDTAGPDAGQLQVAANVVAEVVKGGDAQQRVADVAPRGRYEISVDPESPLVRIRATGPDEASAVDAASAVVDEITAELKRLQGADAATVDPRVTTNVLALPVMGREIASSGDDPVFEAEASVMFVGDGGSEVKANPFTQLGRSTMTVIAEQSNSQGFVEHLESRGAIAGFEITPDQEAALLRVVVTGSDEETVAITTEAVYEGLDKQLGLRQDELQVPDATRVHLEVLSPPEITQVPGERMKPLLMLGALGVGSAVGLAVLVEGIVGRRRRHATAEALDADQDLAWDWSELDPDAVSERVRAGGRGSPLDDDRGSG